MSFSTSQGIAAFGEGAAGAAFARARTLAGLSVRVFDKSHGQADRLAVSRVGWVDRKGKPAQLGTTKASSASRAAPRHFKPSATAPCRASWLAEWASMMDAGSLPPDAADASTAFVVDEAARRCFA